MVIAAPTVAAAIKRARVLTRRPLSIDRARSVSALRARHARAAARLRATRLHEMLRQRGYPGSAVEVRRAVRRLRPAPQRGVPAPRHAARGSRAS